jgi:hypothetical protein
LSRNSSGNACRAFPLHGSTLCAFHDPAYRPRLLQSASKGGRGKRRPAVPLPDRPIDLSTRRGVLDAAGHLLYLNLTGQVGEHTARQLSRIVATAERALDHDEPIDMEFVIDALNSMLPRIP